MHKKYNKYSNKDLLPRNSSYKRTHVKYKKESDSVNELIKVPQNSKCDISRKYYGDIENTENLKSKHKHREKYYKHKRSELNKSAEHHSKKHERQSSHNIHKAASLIFVNEPHAKHKENYSKKEKRDKERLNKIEKYLEGFNEISQKVRGRNRSSVSLKSSENILENRQRYIRREKTFHGEVTRRRDSVESYPILSEAKKLKDQKLKAKDDKKQKHRENKERDSNKEKDEKYSHRQLLYCQIDNPIEAIDRKHRIEKHSAEFHKNYRERSLNKTKRHSCSKDRSASPRGDEIKIIKLEKSSRNRDHSRQSKEKRSTEQIKYSPRKAKRKDHHRSAKEPKSKVNLGPYDKYFILDKKSDIEDENKYQRKWHRRTNKETSKKVPKSDIVNEKMLKEEKKRKKHFLEEDTNKSKGNPTSTQDEFREKIEDDIKGYFTRIQTLIDKKLDFILHGSSKESKINDTGKENGADIAQHKKKRRSESKEAKHAPHRSKSTKKHKSRKHDKVRNRDYKEHIKRNHKSHTSMTREEMKLIDGEYKRQKRYKSLNRHDLDNIPSTNNLGNNERELRHHRRHNAPQPDFDDRLLPNHLVNMVENVSAYSMRSKKSYSGEKVAVKEMNSEAKLRPKHAHKVTNNDNNQHKSHRESSSGRRNLIADEMMCAGVANDFCLEDMEPPKLLESYRKKSRRRLYRPLNLECKTVSIIGIPSQIKESIIFNETQTTTSLNIVNPVEDPVERKKKTKRFKLYYKYSLANNICRSDSGNSSDGKSIISDSYRIVSGNSEHNSEVCLNNTEQEPTKESRKVVFVMKRESLANVSGDTSDNQIAIEQFSRKCRKQRAVTPVASKLNNIVEEPSNISCLDEINKTLQSINSDLNCKYFNILESSSSACNLHLLKKTALSDWNIPMGKCKCRIFDNHPEKMPVHKNHGKKFTHEKDSSLENKSIRRVEINQMHDKKIKYRRIREFGQKYNSKSDIDISYDSLQMNSNYKVKVTKNKSKSNLSSHLIENSKYIPSDAYTKRSSYRPDNRYVVNEDPVELKLKENVCQTEYDIDKDAIEELINTNAYKKYVADLIESHQIAHKQDVARSNVPNVDSEAKRLRKKDDYREVTRIPSIIHKKRVEKPIPHCTEIGTESKEVAEEIYISPKYGIRSHIPEKVIPSSKAPQKKLVDVGVEVAIIGEKLRKETSTDRNKLYQKTTDAAVEVKAIKAINSSKQYLINCGRKNTEIIEKHTAPAETKKTSMLKHISLINRDPLKKKRSISEQSKRSISQQSKQQQNYTTDTTPVKLLNNPRLPTYIVSGKSNIHKIERPSSAREKSPNKRDLSQTISDHDIKRSLSAVDKITKPSQSDIKKKPKIGVKCAKAKDVAKKKCVASNTSRLTLIESYKTKTHTRSNSCSYKSRLSNKSNISLCDMNASDQSKITSLVCLDKFMYGTKLNLTSTSHAQSLDQYTTKSLIGDPCHSSRLFLTKDYIPQVNTYQRRKLYGEGIRRKMRKNCQIQDVLVPQVFEVRYLTFEKEAVNEGSEVTSNATFDSNQLYCINKLNSVVTEKYKKANSKPHISKKCRKSKIHDKGNEIRNPFSFSINDVDRLNKSRKKTEVKIEEIFIKGNKLREEREPHIFDLCKHLADIQSSSLIMKDSFDEFKSLGRSSNLKFGENASPDPNFMSLVDYLCESIVGYCSDINVPQEDHKPPQKAVSNTKELIDVNINDTSAQQQEAESTVIDKVSLDHEKPADEKQTKNTSSEKVPAAKQQHSLPDENKRYPEKLINVSPKPLVCGHMSCPTLGGTASSFEFLYEADSTELSKDTILASLTKPRDTILGYALHCNDTVIIRKEAYTSMGKRIDQISNSPTDSGESGYSSNSSKKYSSATSFFKKPHIAALFKPPPPLAVEEQDKDFEKSLIEPQDNPGKVHYKLMSRKCHEYAQKVRIHSENRDLEENFQEIPLDILLGKKNSTFLDYCNSDCSICNEYSDEKEAFKNIFDISENYDKPETLVKRVSKTTLIAKALLEEESLESFEQKENKMETLIYYGNPRCKPSLEIIQNQKPRTKLIDADANADTDADALEQEIIEYPMVLSNTNLHRGSLTLIDVKQNIDYAKDEDPTRDDGKREESQSENSRTNCDRLKAIRDISDSNLYHVEGHSTNTTKSAKVKDESVCDKQLKETVIHSGIASDLLSSYTTSTSETKKLMAKKFFENLLRVYEKEIAVTTRLFQDDDFFINDLLTSVSDAEEKKKRKGKLKTIIKGKIRGYIGNVFAPKSNAENQSVCSLETDQGVATHFENINQRKLKMLANDARKYFSMFVQAVTANKDINDEIKICGLLKLLQRIENGDFTILRTEEEVNFENEIKVQVKEAFINIYEISVKEAKKHKRSLTIDDLKLIKAFVSKYRIGLLSKTDIIATYIGRGIFKTETHLSAAVTYLIRVQSKDVNLKEFEEYCKVCTCTKSKKK